jgi:hypothetical protein
VKDKEAHRFWFPRYRLPSGGYVKVHTGTGKDNRGDLYWDLDNFIWNNDGDKAPLGGRGGHGIHAGTRVERVLTHPSTARGRSLL